MNNSLKNLFFKYQDFPSFLNHSPITSVHDLGFMGETLLNLAVNSQSKKDVILLIENGANVNQQGELNFTPIQNACLHGNLDIIEILLKNGAKTNKKMSLDMMQNIIHLKNITIKRNLKKLET